MIDLCLLLKLIHHLSILERISRIKGVCELVRFENAQSYENSFENTEVSTEEDCEMNRTSRSKSLCRGRCFVHIGLSLQSLHRPSVEFLRTSTRLRRSSAEFGYHRSRHVFTEASCSQSWGAHRASAGFHRASAVFTEVLPVT